MAKIVFMGTPEFAVPTLQALLDSPHQVSLVLCQPDRKQGRGHKTQAPPVKQLAQAAGIEVFQPEQIKNRPDVAERLAAEKADFFVVVAYGKILPQEILDLPAQGCINVHASLLPRWRGAAPIQYALLAGDQKTGCCTMLMDIGMDTGDLLLCEETPIGPAETAETLTPRLSGLGAKLLVQTLDRFEEITAQRQDPEVATYAKLINKEDRLIDFNQPARDLANRFRALSPKPGVFCSFRGKRLALLDCRLALGSGKPGEVIALDEQSVTIACAKDALQLVEVRPESKGPMNARAFANGYQIKLGDQLGGA